MEVNLRVREAGMKTQQATTSTTRGANPLLFRLKRFGTAGFYVQCEITRILEYEGIMMRETASQLQRFLCLSKGFDIFLRMRQKAAYRDARVRRLASL
jgi:N-methylhydantoinase A/oxoprolinase/acetone carboxylase beta subunit